MLWGVFTRPPLAWFYFCFTFPGFDATDCPVEIQVLRHSEYKINVGNSLDIDCPVHYCKEKPVMQWCKIDANAICVELKESKIEWNSKVFTLKFFSVHQNDSGIYRCRAIGKNFSSESHGINVIIEGEAHILWKSPFKWKDATHIQKSSCIQDDGSSQHLPPSSCVYPASW